MIHNDRNREGIREKGSERYRGRYTETKGHIDTKKGKYRDIYTQTHRGR